MKSFLSGFFVAIAALTLAACNTIQGAGRDITRAGEVLEEATDGND